MKELIHVLYVDDEPDLLVIGKVFLEGSGDFTVTTDESAISALQRIGESSFDVIISDYQMPRMDGIEFLKRVRSTENPIPFILFTGRGREEVVIQALNEGADFYIQKGGDPKAQFAELAHKIRLAVRQRRLETRVRDHERLEADIINFLPDATFAINTDGIVIAWNQAMTDMTGINSGNIIGKGDYEYALPFYRERRPILINLILNYDPAIASKYPLIKRTGKLLSSEIFIPHFHEGTGASFWFTASPLYDNQGTIIGAIESIRDVTESKRTEHELLRKHEELQAAYEEIFSADEELRKNLEKMTLQHQELTKREQQIQAMASNIPGVIFRIVVDPEGDFGFEYISERSLDILGIKNDPRTFSEEATAGIVPEDRERFLASIQEAIASKTQWKFEGRYRKPSGEIIQAKAVSSPFIDGDRFVFDGIIFDDTPWKKMDEFNRLLAKISDNAPASIMVHDPDGNILYANEKTFELHGYSREEFLTRNIYELQVVEDEQREAEQRRLILLNGNMTYEVEHFCRDGSKIPLHVNVKTIEWEGKKVLLNIATDLTERREYEEELHRKTEELDFRIQLIHVILETVPIGIFMVEAPSGRPLISNPAATRLLGRGILPDASEESLSEVYEAYKLGTSEKYPTGEMPIVRGMYGESSHIDDMEVLHPDGTKVLLEVFGNPVTDTQGHIFASLVSFLDITDRKRYERLLKESEENARVLINAETESIFMMKPDGTILYANETMASRFGYTVEEITGKSAYTVAPSGVAEERKKYVDQVIRTRERVQFIDERFGRIIENNLYPVLDESGEVSRIAVYGRDITDREEATRKIAESEEKYRNVVEQAHDGIVIVQGTRLVFSNEAFSRISGYMPGELERFDSLIPEEAGSETDRSYDRIITGLVKSGSFEGTLVRKDKTIFSVEINAVEITYQGTAAFLFLIRDISDRKKAEEVQKKTLNLLNEVQMLAKLGGWEYEVSTGRVSWTDEVYRIYGVGPEYDPNDIRKDISFYSPEDAHIIEEAFFRALKEKVPYDLELKFIRADGRQIWVRTRGQPVQENGKVIRMTGNIIDITERKQLELYLREAIQKLRVLTGITRHDVLNNLSAITLSLEMIRESDDEESKMRYISRAEDAVRILEKTIGFTREYEKFGSISSQWYNILSIVSSATNETDLAGITVHITLPRDLEIYSDPIIRKVFSTLLENAVRHGGETLSRIQVYIQNRDPDLVMVFEDNGAGIPVKEKDLIFTHGYGKHTGIGLFLAREILSITGLSIKECGVEGKGARFEILVPEGGFRYQS
jgi:PAS domain S-box-containing protein